MATKEMYEKIKHLTKDEILEVAKHCCDDICDLYTNIDDEEAEDDFCESKCPYLDIREEEDNPNRWCRQWVMHDLIKLIEN